MILFIGINPSKRNVSNDIPFVGTRSMDVLLKWIYKLKIHEFKIINLTNRIKFNNDLNEDELLNLKQICKNHELIIALGDLVSDYLTDLKVKHFKLPHPSGLNRKLNDKKFVKKCLEDCKKYINK